MCANGPQQLLKTSNLYPRCKKCDIEKTLGEWVPPPLGSPKVKRGFMSAAHDDDIGLDDECKDGNWTI